MVIAAKHPANATVDPTERSKPPPMITKVMPIAMTAMIDDCTRMLLRLSGERKRWVKSAVMRHSANSAIRAPCPERVRFNDGVIFMRRLRYEHVPRRNRRRVAPGR